MELKQERTGYHRNLRGVKLAASELLIFFIFFLLSFGEASSQRAPYFHGPASLSMNLSRLSRSTPLQTSDMCVNVTNKIINTIITPAPPQTFEEYLKKVRQAKRNGDNLVPIFADAPLRGGCWM